MCLNAFIFKQKTVFYNLLVRDLIEIINYIIPNKRCWYYLQKWSEKGYYNYGVTLDSGWFEPDKFTGIYKEIYLEIRLKRER
jgi:hypothetical protein